MPTMPPPLTRLHDREALADRFRHDPELHLFELGDLDDPFWPHTTWYTLADGSDDGSDEDTGDGPVALLYGVGELPTLLGLTRPERHGHLTGLLRAMGPVLPDRFLAHLTGGGAEALAPGYRVEHRTAMLRMALTDRTALGTGAGSWQVGPLGAPDLADLLALFAAGYPGNWFDERMLTTGPYVGVRDADGRLVAAAGVHVHSPARRVAVIGNVTTHPEFRGRGLAAACTTRLCEVLSPTTDHIGLNVRADHPTAVSLYGRLGFTTVTAIDECVIAAV
ncbi:GNAT family N-acetyltransferase [Kitasatospora sp. NPDC001574]